LAALVRDLLREVVPAPEDLLDLGEDVLAVVLADREDQGLRQLAAAGGTSDASCLG
jgi:hypothetical protein